METTLTGLAKSKPENNLFLGSAPKSEKNSKQKGPVMISKFRILTI